MSGIRVIGRLHFLVQSASRPEVEHVIDWEPNVYSDGPTCSCECNRKRLEPCKHLKAVESFLVDAVEKFKKGVF